MNNRRIAWWSLAAAVWTFIAWGNRIGLLTGNEASEPWTWIRVGGSLLLGAALLVVAIALLRRRPFTRMMGVVFIVFGILMVVVWGRSAISVLTDDESLAFKLVHLVLAVISIGFGIVLTRLALQQHSAQKRN